jgi:hypothetical protein
VPVDSPDLQSPPRGLAPGRVQAPRQKLAEPPIPGGRVDAMMGALIRVLAHSPLARPVPAVTLSALGLAGVAFVGLCATMPAPSATALPVWLPLTALAHRLCAPQLPVLTADLIMYTAIGLCVLGLAGMLWANSRGWRPDPRHVFWTAAGTVAVLVNITPVGSSDPASYAAYGRIAALGHDPYVFVPADLPGHLHNSYTVLVGTQWQRTPSVYGPVATWAQQAAAVAGGARPWATVWVLMIITGAAFLAAGYLLLRMAANPVRAGLIWVANPLLIEQLVVGGHLDALVALAAAVAIVVSRRGRSLGHDAAVGVVVGVAAGIKVNAVLVALGIMVPLLRARAWMRLVRTGAVAAATALALYGFSYGLQAFKPLEKASALVISPSPWRLAQLVGDRVGANPAVTSALIGALWPALMIALAWYLYNRLSPDVPTVVAATCALTFAWVAAAPWSLPWYASIAWVTLALLPRNSLTRWLTLVTGGLALLHFNGGHTPDPGPVGPTP